MKKRPAKRRTTKKPRKQVVPVPPGFVAVEEFEPAPEPGADHLADLRTAVNQQVRAGFLDDRTLRRFIRDLFSDDIPARDLRRLLPPLIAEARDRLAREQARWPKVTDCDRLDTAFADLERRGILARQNYWCCGTCGCAAIDDEMTRLRRRRPVRGYAFYHEQDTTFAVDGHGLHLNYGSIEDDERSSVAIGREIVTVLTSHGLKTRWNGNLDERIKVSLNWKRRSTT